MLKQTTYNNLKSKPTVVLVELYFLKRRPRQASWRFTMWAVGSLRFSSRSARWCPTMAWIMSCTFSGYCLWAWCTSFVCWNVLVKDRAWMKKFKQHRRVLRYTFLLNSTLWTRWFKLCGHIICICSCMFLLHNATGTMGGGHSVCLLKGSVQGHFRLGKCISSPKRLAYKTAGLLALTINLTCWKLLDKDKVCWDA